MSKPWERKSGRNTSVRKPTASARVDSLIEFATEPDFLFDFQFIRMASCGCRLRQPQDAIREHLLKFLDIATVFDNVVYDIVEHSGIDEANHDSPFQIIWRHSLEPDVP